MHLLWNASTPFYGFELSFLKLIWRIQRNGSWSWTERVSGSRSSIILLQRVCFIHQGDPSFLLTLPMRNNQNITHMAASSVCVNEYMKFDHLAYGLSGL
ncbi:hypothetical protein D9758_013472 [Tetrapyrgos nigripes]|uniref:Uncharacterized protein n=1 Tax=Tetrapyrgos nigripes TaxID=182062 RepID=A0A8H5CS30_9AGAR|nr:hypothetical protein D9758_013472 [Tetrapyrgos nigripes]